MDLALKAALTVLVTMGIVGAIGFLIDRSQDHRK
jgi:preprotein translocase subunit Sss1